jgi:hypothetical protein
MSHFSLIKIKIKNPNVALLKRAVELIAKEIGGEVVSRINDYYGRTMDCIVGIKSADFPRGIGVKINSNGEVEVVGDFWKVRPDAVENFQKALVQYYTALAMQQALAQLGYHVQVNKVNDKVHVRGVALL